MPEKGNTHSFPVQEILVHESFLHANDTYQPPFSFLCKYCTAQHELTFHSYQSNIKLSFLPTDKHWFCFCWEGCTLTPTKPPEAGCKSCRASSNSYRTVLTSDLKILVSQSLFLHQPLSTIPSVGVKFDQGCHQQQPLPLPHLAITACLFHEFALKLPNHFTRCKSLQTLPVHCALKTLLVKVNSKECQHSQAQPQQRCTAGSRPSQRHGSQPPPTGPVSVWRWCELSSGSGQSPARQHGKWLQLATPFHWSAKRSPVYTFFSSS